MNNLNDLDEPDRNTGGEDSDIPLSQIFTTNIGEFDYKGDFTAQKWLKHTNNDTLDRIVNAYHVFLSQSIAEHDDFEILDYTVLCCMLREEESYIVNNVNVEYECCVCVGVLAILEKARRSNINEKQFLFDVGFTDDVKISSVSDVIGNSIKTCRIFSEYIK